MRAGVTSQREYRLTNQGLMFTLRAFASSDMFSKVIGRPIDMLLDLKCAYEHKSRPKTRYAPPPEVRLRIRVELEWFGTGTVGLKGYRILREPQDDEPAFGRNLERDNSRGLLILQTYPSSAGAFANGLNDWQICFPQTDQYIPKVHGRIPAQV